MNVKRSQVLSKQIIKINPEPTTISYDYEQVSSEVCANFKSLLGDVQKRIQQLVIQPAPSKDVFTAAILNKKFKKEAYKFKMSFIEDWKKKKEFIECNFKELTLSELVVGRQAASMKQILTESEHKSYTLWKFFSDIYDEEKFYRKIVQRYSNFITYILNYDDVTQRIFDFSDLTYNNVIEYINEPNDNFRYDYDDRKMTKVQVINLFDDLLLSAKKKLFKDEHMDNDVALMLLMDKWVNSWLHSTVYFCLKRYGEPQNSRVLDSNVFQRMLELANTYVLIDDIGNDYVETLKSMFKQQVERFPKMTLLEYINSLEKIPNMMIVLHEI